MIQLKGTIQQRFIEQIKTENRIRFTNTYSFIFTKFAIGNATVSGMFHGVRTPNTDGTYHIEGLITYNFEDEFSDPYDLINKIPGDWNPDGEPYKITDTWSVYINGDY